MYIKSPAFTLAASCADPNVMVFEPATTPFASVYEFNEFSYKIVEN